MTATKTLEQVRAEGYKYHHSASCRGYVRVADRGTCVPYKGKYGTGYICSNGKHNNSTMYMSISYYIKSN